MGYPDLRSFLSRLEQEGQLVFYHDEIRPEPEVRALMRGAADLGPGGPAVLLDSITGYRGQKLLVNVHGSWANHALMLEMSKAATLKEQFCELERRWDGYPGQLRWTDDPPCREVVLDEGQFNLLQLLPLCRINEHDGGFYLSKASVVTKDPERPDDLETENVGIYRLQVQDGNTLAMQALPFHDVAIHIRRAEELGQPLPIAICLGVDPVLSFVASTPLPYDHSEYLQAAALSGDAMVLAKTSDGYLDVPAGAEFVLEGFVVPGQRVPEGPFGEFSASYSGMRKQVLVKVCRVTHRSDPIFENLYIGRSWNESDTLLGLNTCVQLYKQIRETMPEVAAVNALYQHGLTTIIAVEPRFGGYAKSVAFRAFSTPHGISYVKNVILVDAHVDPFDLVQVMWALSTRIRDARDVVVVPGTPGMPLDPASEPPGMSCKVIIDATTPVAPERRMSDTHLVGEVPGSAAFSRVLSDLQSAPNGLALQAQMRSAKEAGEEL